MEVCPLSRSQLEVLKEKILKEREYNLNTIPEVNLNLDGDKDSVDIANFEISGEISTTLKRMFIEKEKKFQNALLKISQSSYGICVECEGFIGFSRLLSNPSADMCIVCKEEAERGI